MASQESAPASPASPEKSSKIPERHSAVAEPATGNEWRDTTLERRADQLETLIHQDIPTRFLVDTLGAVEKRLQDNRRVAKMDRIQIPEAFSSLEASRHALSLSQELRGSTEEEPVTLASVMGQAMTGDSDRRAGVKALGMRILQLYSPSGKRDSWRHDSFTENRKQRVRVGELLVVAGQMGDMAAEMKSAGTEKIDLARAKRYYVEFSRYVVSHDVPASVRQQLLDSMKMLEQQHPLLTRPPEEYGLTQLSTKHKQEIARKAQAAHTRWPRSAEEIPVYEAEVVYEAEAVEEPEPAQAEPESPFRAEPEQFEREESAFEAEASSMGHTTVETVSVETDTSATDPLRRQARETIQQWREADVEFASVPWLRTLLERHKVTDGTSEGQWQRYLELMNNELGHRDVLHERGALNFLTSRWIEPLYTRMVVNPVNPYKWFSQSGREDVQQARQNLATSLQHAAADVSVDSQEKAFLLELASQYRGINDIERAHSSYYREAVGAGLSKGVSGVWSTIKKPFAGWGKRFKGWFGRGSVEIVGGETTANPRSTERFEVEAEELAPGEGTSFNRRP